MDVNYLGFYYFLEFIFGCDVIDFSLNSLFFYGLNYLGVIIIFYFD